MISIVVPVYNEEELIEELHGRIVSAMKTHGKPFEIIFVNDGSNDGSLEKMRDLRPLKVISLQRNCGETPALDVGIQEATGEIIVLIDADLQHDPADIPRLLEALGDDAYDVIIGWRKKRHDTFSRIVFSRCANAIARFVLGIPIHDFGSGLKVYRAQFIKDFRLWGDAQVFLPAIAKEKGARILEVEIDHHARKAGSSKIRIGHMIRGSFDLLSVVFFAKYFYKPLRFFGGWGAIALLLSVVAFIAAIILRLTNTLAFTETPLPVIGSLFAILGVMLVMMGFLAEIMLRTYYATVNRSPYLIREIIENK